jgi:uncharacterized surface anchored protein
MIPFSQTSLKLSIKHNKCKLNIDKSTEQNTTHITTRKHKHKHNNNSKSKTTISHIFSVGGGSGGGRITWPQICKHFVEGGFRFEGTIANFICAERAW